MFSPLAGFLQLQALPLGYFPWLVLILAGYMVLTQCVKGWFVRRYGWQYRSPLRPGGGNCDPVRFSPQRLDICSVLRLYLQRWLFSLRFATALLAVRPPPVT